MVRRKLGWGHFSTVWLCDEIPVPVAQDDPPPSPGTGAGAAERGELLPPVPLRQVALKVQKSSARYTEAAADEARLLRAAARRAGLWSAVREEEEFAACTRREKKRQRLLARAASVRARLDRGLPKEVAVCVGTLGSGPEPPEAQAGGMQHEEEESIGVRDLEPPVPVLASEHVRRWTSLGRAPPPMPGPTPAPVTRLLSGFTAKSRHGRHACLAMGVLDGGNLLDLVRSHDHRGLPPLISRRLMRRTAESLDLLTRGAGLIHTDVKLENLILAPCYHVPWQVPPSEKKASLDTKTTPDQENENDDEGDSGSGGSSD